MTPAELIEKLWKEGPVRTTQWESDVRNAYFTYYKFSPTANTEILERVRTWRNSHEGKRYAYFDDLDVILGGSIPNRPATRDTLNIRAAMVLVSLLYGEDVSSKLIVDLLKRAIDE